ncbi:hypothetical protein BV509_19985 [Rhodovulum sulfidophilum]|uniref:histidine kinase n=1 Tax=Rhodovulum visakhapatnamense TaxID=364297 RepID=A0ABS1RDG3_9RHOB|nr:ATP-binding protein [Rhodovulum visakhapatnamense]MBL3570588.1 hypothetical protein [Rhodovulum visakhapatnamense]MBL3577565.1 hypothetical protein [Rhodovulum visakhapatnamense]OLS46403.1 hypothetical protein BV509_19985 [Rhodovulum sulfidophilum]
MDHRREIDRLYALEFGRPQELLLRGLGVAVGGAVLQEAAGWAAVLIWMVGYGLANLTYLAFLRSRGRICTARDTRIAGGLFLAALVSFLWLPATLGTEDEAAVRITALSMLGCAMVFLIRRGDSQRWLVLAETAVIGLALMVLVAMVLPRIDSMAVRGAATGSGLAMLGYFAHAIWAGRRLRLAAEAAAYGSLQAQKMQAMGELAGGIAHDFNNMLMALQANLDFYRDSSDPTDRDRCIAEAAAAADRAAALARRLLAFAQRAEPAGRDRVDLCLALEEVRSLVRPLIPPTIRMRIAPPEAPVLVEVAQDQLVAALINLLLNARDALRLGGGLALETRPVRLTAPRPMLDGSRLPRGAYAEISITDTGSGIPDEILSRVTEPFFTTKPAGEGTGLGLAMVQGFTRSAQGGLDIASSRAGTRVSLYLPLAA